MTAYILRRTLPDGTVREHSSPMTRRKAAAAAFFVLTDNGVMHPRVATAAVRPLEADAVSVSAGGYVFDLILAGEQ